MYTNTFLFGKSRKMLSTRQKTFVLFSSGLFTFGLSILLLSTPYFSYSLMLGLWLMMLSAIFYRIYGTRTETPRLSIGRKEKLIENLKTLFRD